MPLNQEQLTKLRKLMQLSLSANDNEALSALRKANSMLVENKMNWEDLFKMNIGESISMAEFQKRHSEAFQKAYGATVSTFGNMSNVRMWRHL